MASLLPLPGPPFPEPYQALIDAWNDGSWQARIGPLRSTWLGEFEFVLRYDFPQSSSRDRKLTARHYAPFPLSAGKDVP